MEYLDQKELLSPDSFGFAELDCDANGHLINRILEANDATLRFYRGMNNIKSVHDMLGESSISYGERLRTMSREALEIFLNREFNMLSRVKRGERFREENLVVLLPGPEKFILVWDHEKIPVIKDKKVVGFKWRNVFNNKNHTSEDILDLYVKAYGDGKKGALAFCKQYGLEARVGKAVRLNPRMLRLLLAIAHKNKGRAIEEELPYTEKSIRALTYNIRKSLKDHGSSLRDIQEILEENHKKRVWEPIWEPGEEPGEKD